MSGAARLAPSAVSDQGRIPVLDIGPFLAGEPDAAPPLGAPPACGRAVVSDPAISREPVARADRRLRLTPPPAAPNPGGQRVRFPAAPRQHFLYIPRAVGAPRPWGAHGGGRGAPPAG